MKEVFAETRCGSFYRKDQGVRYLACKAIEETGREYADSLSVRDKMRILANAYFDYIEAGREYTPEIYTSRDNADYNQAADLIEYASIPHWHISVNIHDFLHGIYPCVHRSERSVKVFTYRGNISFPDKQRLHNVYAEAHTLCADAESKETLSCVLSMIEEYVTYVVTGKENEPWKFDYHVVQESLDIIEQANWELFALSENIMEFAYAIPMAVERIEVSDA